MRSVSPRCSFHRVFSNIDARGREKAALVALPFYGMRDDERNAGANGPSFVVHLASLAGPASLECDLYLEIEMVATCEPLPTTYTSKPSAVPKTSSASNVSTIAGASYARVSGLSTGTPPIVLVR